MKNTGFEASLAQRMEALDARYQGGIPAGELGSVIGSILGSLDGDLSATDLRVQAELSDMLSYIERAKAEIAAIRPNEIRSERIPGATDELDAVIKATEEATGTILDAAEELENLAPTLEAAAGEKLQDIATRIYEASNFQDITGQRIAKVVATLRYIEERLGLLSDLLHVEDRRDGSGPSPDGKADPAEADLLNGPALPAAAHTQADIDALFDSLG